MGLVFIFSVEWRARRWTHWYDTQLLLWLLDSTKYQESVYSLPPWQHFPSQQPICEWVKCLHNLQVWGARSTASPKYTEWPSVCDKVFTTPTCISLWVLIIHSPLLTFDISKISSAVLIFDIYILICFCFSHLYKMIWLLSFFLFPARVCLHTAPSFYYYVVRGQHHQSL